MTNVPSVLVCAGVWTWVSVLRAVTVAPGTIAPEASVTAPLTWVRVDNCALQSAAASTSATE